MQDLTSTISVQTATRVAAAVGIFRIVAHPLNAWVESYIRKAVSPEQFLNLTKGGSTTWKWINFFVHLFTSVSLSSVIGAIAVHALGDRDLRIQLPPYPVSSGLPPNQSSSPKPMLQEPQQIKSESQ